MRTRRQTASHRRLPLELYGEIVQHVDNIPDLRRLSFVSRMFHQDAQRRLYRCFDVRILHKQSHFRSLRALTKNSIIATQLRSLNFNVIFHANSGPLNNSWIDLLKEAFLSLNNLKELQLPWGLAPYFIPPESVKFRLEMLRCTLSSTHWNSMIRFLQDQDMIHTLALDNGPGDYKSLPSRCLPNLFRLYACSDLAFSLLYGRPVKYIHLEDGEAFRWPRGMAVGPSVEFLHIMNLAASKECYAYFPSVRYLEILVVGLTFITSQACALTRPPRSPCPIF